MEVIRWIIPATIDRCGALYLNPNADGEGQKSLAFFSDNNAQKMKLSQGAVYFFMEDISSNTLP